MHVSAQFFFCVSTIHFSNKSIIFLQILSKKFCNSIAFDYLTDLIFSFSVFILMITQYKEYIAIILLPFTIIVQIRCQKFLFTLCQYTLLDIFLKPRYKSSILVFRFPIINYMVEYIIQISRISNGFNQLIFLFFLLIF